ncbi:hypothetical protein BCR44DRAFT_38414 [Catenaria anguillulae PL171]|uniref:Uncharacterized protein n=1 Tax=Catenaria anguillulae PL171 TaxID=765915 RepID=A0A1Y2HPH7_9FUNG|nr:hypothetical protein BCR44DRAFT_38414 [Catenaria anguillulae PL171]
MSTGNNVNADCAAAGRLFAGGDSAINPVSCCQGQHLTAIDLACNPDGRITRLAITPASLPADVAFRGDALSSSLAQLTRLQVLRLPNAGLAGAFPAAAISQLPDLTFLDLSGNALSGTLPESLSAGLPKLDSLNLNGNSMTGSLAPLRNAPLSTLSVAGNTFSGQLPSITSLTSCVGLPAGVCRPFEGPTAPCAASLPPCPRPTTTSSSAVATSATTTTSGATSTSTTTTAPTPTSTVNLNAAATSASSADLSSSSSSSMTMWLSIAGGILGAVLLSVLLLLLITRRRRHRRLAQEKLASTRHLTSPGAMERGAPLPALATYSKVSTKPASGIVNDDPEDQSDNEQDLADSLLGGHALRHVDSADHLLITSPNSPHAMVVEPPRVPGHGTDTHSMLTTNTRNAAAAVGAGAWARTLRQGSFSDQPTSAAAITSPPTLRGKPSRMSLASGLGLGGPLSPPTRPTLHAHTHPVPGSIIDVTGTDVYDMFFGLPRVPGCTTAQLHPRATPPEPAASTRHSHMWRTTMVSESGSASTGADDAEEWATVSHLWDATLDALHARITRFMTSPTSMAAAQIAGETAWSLVSAELDFTSGSFGFLGTNPDQAPPPSPTLGATSTGRAARTAAVMHFASVELVKFLAGVQSSAAVAKCAHRVYGVAGMGQGELVAGEVPRVFAAMARVAGAAVRDRLVNVAPAEVDEVITGTEAAGMDDTEVDACAREFVHELRALAGEYEGNLALKLNVLGCTPSASGAGTPVRSGSPFLESPSLSATHAPSAFLSTSALGLADVFVLAAIHWARIKALRPGLGLVIVPPGAPLQQAWMDDSANQNASARPYVQVQGTCFPALVEAVPDVMGGQGWGWRVVKAARVWMREDGPRRAIE